MRSSNLLKIHTDPIHLELETAREVQKQFFPYRLPPVEGLDYYGAYRTAQQVGGDFFDFFPLSNGSLAFSIGDVSGKGIPAALIMAAVQASLRALAANGHPPLPAVIGKLSSLVLEISPSNFYATMFFAQIDSRRRELRYVSAGHEPALLLRDKARRLIPLGSTGPALGVIRGAEYNEVFVPLEAGDILVAVTDGVSERVDSANPEAYEEVVLDCIRRHPHETSNYLAEEILQCVERWRPEPPTDDRTVVVARALVPEVANAGEHHRQAQLVGCGDDLLVAH